MTAPALARKRGDDRVYVWPPGIRPTEMIVPSVTTILKQKSKATPLMKWAAREVAEFAVEHILEWQELPPDAAVHLLKTTPDRNTKARDLGSAIHNSIDLHIGGTVPVLEDLELLPYVGGALAFLDDLVAEILFSEVTIFNRTYQYAGTTDVIARLVDGRIAVIDWKSGNNIYPEVAMQLSAYANGEFIGTEDGEEIEVPEVDIGIVVHLRPDGTYRAPEVELTPRVFKSFLAARTLQKWDDDHAATALGKVHKGSAKPADTTEGGK